MPQDFKRQWERRLENLLPMSAGVCAYDIDECTVTLAFDTKDEALIIVEALPSRNRVRVMP